MILRTRLRILLFACFLLNGLTHSFDWSFTAIKSACAQGWASIKQEPGKLLPYALLGAFSSFVAYRFYRHYTRPSFNNRGGNEYSSKKTEFVLSDYDMISSESNQDLNGDKKISISYKPGRYSFLLDEEEIEIRKETIKSAKRIMQIDK